MHYFDSYPIQSRLRKVHPGVKMSLYAMFTALALLSHSILLSTLLFSIITFSICYTAQISILRLFRLLLIPASFVFLSCISILIECNPLTQTLFLVKIWGNNWGITSVGMYCGLLLFMRSLSSISILYALILNTSISDILYVLRSIKIPEIMLDIMVLVYRNIFIFSDTAKSIYTSQKSRLGYRNFRSAMVSSGKLGGRIFVLAEVKAEHLFQSMESRCYNGKINTLPGEWEINKPFILIALGVLVFLSTGLFYV